MSWIMCDVLSWSVCAGMECVCGVMDGMCCHGVCVLSWSRYVVMDRVSWMVRDVMECTCCHGVCVVSVMVWCHV